MLQTDETATARTEAYARGMDEGWSAANYAAAYGQSGESLADEAARRAWERYSDAAVECCAYVSGFTEGAERYEADQWQDGTPRHDEADDQDGQQ
ncbi:hypothetical protein GCM10009789_83260 [Kribbella sancticallisti]|uniref:Uncharacterized protein n=1 Tax=Kribbella sancticallisti TaxID=460087 RepID=A0ABP4QNB8_9ACTN